MLRARLAAYHAGEISFAELHASIQGWMAHDGYADSWGLHRHVLASLVTRLNIGAADGARLRKPEPALPVAGAQVWATHTTRNPLLLSRVIGGNLTPRAERA